MTPPIIGIIIVAIGGCVTLGAFVAGVFMQRRKSVARGGKQTGRSVASSNERILAHH